MVPAQNPRSHHPDTHPPRSIFTVRSSRGPPESTFPVTEEARYPASPVPPSPLSWVRQRSPRAGTGGAVPAARAPPRARGWQHLRWAREGHPAAGRASRLGRGRRAGAQGMGLLGRALGAAQTGRAGRAEPGRARPRRHLDARRPPLAPSLSASPGAAATVQSWNQPAESSRPAPPAPQPPRVTLAKPTGWGPALVPAGGAWRVAEAWLLLPGVTEPGKTRKTQPLPGRAQSNAGTSAVMAAACGSPASA